MPDTLPDSRTPAAAPSGSWKLEAACAAVCQPLTLRRHAGSDHGYYFIASVIDDHLRHHAQQLGR